MVNANILRRVTPQHRGNLHLLLNNFVLAPRDMSADLLASFSTLPSVKHFPWLPFALQALCGKKKKYLGLISTNCTSWLKLQVLPQCHRSPRPLFPPWVLLLRTVASQLSSQPAPNSREIKGWLSSSPGFTQLLLSIFITKRKQLDRLLWGINGVHFCARLRSRFFKN